MYFSRLVPTFWKNLLSPAFSAEKKAADSSVCEGDPLAPQADKKYLSVFLQIF
jgi:hypothetical protein